MVSFVVWAVSFLCSVAVLAWVYRAIFESRATLLHALVSLAVGIVWVVVVLHSWRLL